MYILLGDRGTHLARTILDSTVGDRTSDEGRETLLLPSDLVEKRDVERKSKLVLQADVLRQLLAQFARRGRRIGKQHLRVSIHKRDWQHQRLFQLGRLQFQPAWRLISCSVRKRSPQSLLAVSCVARRTFFDEAAQIAHELARGNISVIKLHS